jgi:predicted ArsR family transcriptional regulator
VALWRKTRRSEAGTSADAWSAVAVLAEPRRRDLYDFVAMQDAPVSRDEVAAGLDMTRSLAAFHLDKLAEAGLLEATFRRAADRTSGPGAGRPSKLYSVSAKKLDVSIPPRREDVVGRIMARAIAGSSARRGENVTTLAMRLAEQEGRTVGAAHPAPRRSSTKSTLAAAEETLATCGYEPTLDGQIVRLRNCPFHSIVEVAPRLVCELNESFVSGVLEGLGGQSTVEAELCGPVDGDCCVIVRPKSRGRTQPSD